VSTLVSLRGAGAGAGAGVRPGSSTAGALRLCIVSSGIAAFGSATSLNCGGFVVSTTSSSLSPRPKMP
jgi:hypothetical protein